MGRFPTQYPGLGRPQGVKSLRFAQMGGPLPFFLVCGGSCEFFFGDEAEIGAGCRLGVWNSADFLGGSAVKVRIIARYSRVTSV